ncbi:hypothetical protein CBR_g84858 [Chara braunii]|uniref:Uncharacterized protein n=1 Tax=Chara braunii TaxID=69332 RepID=A0A388KAV3_CHABU|nr:hypothetical protein CBR_g84858 [Chara braunii]|eukprot:GBG67194.1 hypothetical protein CBR_g84858 [Chara braunii]
MTKSKQSMLLQSVVPAAAMKCKMARAPVKRKISWELEQVEAVVPTSMAVRADMCPSSTKKARCTGEENMPGWIARSPHRLPGQSPLIGRREVVEMARRESVLGKPLSSIMSMASGHSECWTRAENVPSCGKEGEAENEGEGILRERANRVAAGGLLRANSCAGTSLLGVWAGLENAGVNGWTEAESTRKRFKTVDGIAAAPAAVTVRISVQGHGAGMEKLRGEMTAAKAGLLKTLSLAKNVECDHKIQRRLMEKESDQLRKSVFKHRSTVEKSPCALGGCSRNGVSPGVAELSNVSASARAAQLRETTTTELAHPAGPYYNACATDSQDIVERVSECSEKKDSQSRKIQMKEEDDEDDACVAMSPFFTRVRPHKLAIEAQVQEIFERSKAEADVMSSPVPSLSVSGGAGSVDPLATSLSSSLTDSLSDALSTPTDQRIAALAEASVEPCAPMVCRYNKRRSSRCSLNFQEEALGGEIGTDMSTTTRYESCTESSSRRSPSSSRSPSPTTSESSSSSSSSVVTATSSPVRVEARAFHARKSTAMRTLPSKWYPR